MNTRSILEMLDILLLISSFIVPQTNAVADLSTPVFQWPLCQLTMAYDTVNKVDATNPKHNECPTLASGPPMMTPPFQAFWFKTNTDYVHLNTLNSNGLQFQSFTVSMYIYPDALDGVILFYKATNPPGSKIAKFYVILQSGHIKAFFQDKDDNTLFSIKSGSVLILSQWNLVFLAVDLTLLKVTVRINEYLTQQPATPGGGCEDDCDDSDNESESSDQASVSQLDPNGRMLISHHNLDGHGNFRGGLCCMAIYNDVISESATVVQIIQPFIDPSTLVGDLTGVGSDCQTTTTTQSTTTTTQSTTTTTQPTTTTTQSTTTTPQTTTIAPYPVKELWPLDMNTHGYAVVNTLSPEFPTGFDCLRSKYVCQATSQDSLYFDGSQFIHADYNISDDMFEGDISVSFFIRADQPMEGTIFEFKSSASKTDGILGVELDFDAGQLRLRKRDQNGVCSLLVSNDLVPEVWSFIYIMDKVITKTTSVTISGKRVAVTGSCQSFLSGSTAMGKIRIGRRFDDLSGIIGFHGSISCLTVFDDIVPRNLLEDETVERCQTLSSSFSITDTCNVHTHLKSQRYKLLAKDKHPSLLNTPMAARNVTSLLDCSQTCASYPYCRSFNYNENVSHDQCQFYDFVSNYLLQDDAGNDYYEILADL